MKYAIFVGFCLLCIPLVAHLTMLSARARGWLLAALILSTCLGPRSSIHLVTLTGLHGLPYRGTEDGVIVYVTDVLAAGLFVGLVLRFWRRLTWLPYNTTALAALFMLGLLSAVRASDTAAAAVCMFTWIKAYLIYWCTVNLLSIGTPARYLFDGLAGAAGLVGAVAVKQVVFNHATRTSAMFPHPNTMPSYAFTFVFLLLMWAWCDDTLTSTRRLGAIVACLLLSLGVVQTMSRVGILLLAAGIMVTLLLAMPRTRTTRTRVLIGALLGLLFVGGLVLSGEVVHRFETAPAASGVAREEFNQAALSMADDHVLGIGPNNYSGVLSTQYEYRRHLVVLAYEAESGVCHDIYLLMAAETGWIGLALFLLVVGRFLFLACRLGLASRRLESTLLCGVAIGWIALLANGSTEWAMRQAYIMDMYAVVAAFSVWIAGTISEWRLTNK